MAGGILISHPMKDESLILKQVVVGYGTVAVEFASYTLVAKVGHIKIARIARPMQLITIGSNRQRHSHFHLISANCCSKRAASRIVAA